MLCRSELRFFLPLLCIADSGHFEIFPVLFKDAVTSHNLTARVACQTVFWLQIFTLRFLPSGCCSAVGHLLSILKIVGSLYSALEYLLPILIRVGLNFAKTSCRLLFCNYGISDSQGRECVDVGFWIISPCAPVDMY